MIEALTPLNRIFPMKMYEDIVRSKRFCRISEKSFVNVVRPIKITALPCGIAALFNDRVECLSPPENTLLCIHFEAFDISPKFIIFML